MESPSPKQRGPSPDATAKIVLRWIDAFNDRDLDSVLTLMDPEVRLHPLRLSGVERLYRGHDGVERWFARMSEVGLKHRFDVSALRTDGREVRGVGQMHLAPDEEPVRFWMLDRIEDGRIVTAHHYLTDPGAFPKREGRDPTV